MKINLPYWNNSLKNRVTLTTLIISLSVIWLLAFYSTHVLRKDTQLLLEEQQLTTASFIVASIDDAIKDRFEGLQLISQNIGKVTLKNSATVQAILDQRQLLQKFFNAGGFVTGVDGVALASVPVSLGRVGKSYLDRDFITSTLSEGRPIIGKPVIGKVLGVPLFAMSVPIRDTQNKVIGVLVGVIDLSKPNFLSNITENRYGKTGGYALLSPQHRLVITASDKANIMQALPAVGVSPTLDHIMQGYEGAFVYNNLLGVEVLSVAKQIPTSGWILELTLPTREAFSPIEDMQQRLLLATMMLTLLAGGLTWWMLRRQLSPMLDAINNMAISSASDLHPQPLPITRQDEIGKLLGSFNHLLKTLSQKGDALRNSESRFRAIIEASPVPLAINDAHGKITFLNQAFIQTLGYTLSDIPTLADWWPRAYPDLKYRQEVAERWQSNLNNVKKDKQAFAPLELNIHCKNVVV
jgi:PAS domain-containing protein